jgi:predicted acylesterase/phospholipase RssA
LQQREQAAAHADVYLAPDCSSVSFTGFKRIDQAIDIGYRTALEALGDLDLTAAADAARA